MEFDDNESPQTINFMIMGYENRNAILNLGMLFALLLGAVGAIVFTKTLIAMCGRKEGCWGKFVGFLEKQFCYSFFLRLFVEGYLELCISCFVNFRSLNFGYSGNSAASAFSLVIMGPCVLFPSIITFFLLKQQHLLLDPSFR